MSMFCHCQPLPGCGPCTCPKNCADCEIARAGEKRKRFFTERDALMLFIGLYVGAMSTVVLAYFWEQLQ